MEAAVSRVLDCYSVLRRRMSNEFAMVGTEDENRCTNNLSKVKKISYNGVLLEVL